MRSILDLVHNKTLLPLVWRADFQSVAIYCSPSSILVGARISHGTGSEGARNNIQARRLDTLAELDKWKGKTKEVCISKLFIYRAHRVAAGFAEH